MKSIHVATNAWPSPNGNGPTAYGAGTTGAVPTHAAPAPSRIASNQRAPAAPAGGAAPPATIVPVTSALPSNVFSDLIAGALSNFGQAATWMRQPLMFIAGVLLALGLTLVLIASIMLWPYGLFQQGAERLWLQIVLLHGRYLTAGSASQKVALALAICLYCLVGAVLATVAIPIFLGRAYFRWLATAPVMNAGVSAAALLGVVLLGGLVALIIAFIIPIICIIVVIAVISAAKGN